MPASPSPAARAPVVRRLGRFELQQLLGRSERSMAWRVADPSAGRTLLLVMPRTQPADAAALAVWLEQARRAARVLHPNLAPPVEIGEQEHWPYVAYDNALGPTFVEHRSTAPEAAADVARWIGQALSGLAFAHDAGFAHRDLQAFLLTRDDHGRVALLGLEVAGAPVREPSPVPPAAEARRSPRDEIERDVLGLSIVMHALLAGTTALAEPDVSRVIARLPPLGRDTLRLPWDLPRPIPDALRAIANRATDRQPRQRYRNARTLARALEGWLEADAGQGVDAHAALIERVRQIGALPALPGAGARAARLALMEREHTEELAQVVLRDPALCFELLRNVNSAQVRGTQVSGHGPVLTVRRAIAMLGLDGVRRAALALRPWPGPLDASAAAEMEHTIDSAQRAARLAAALRPAGYDAEVVSLVALMQNLGRLVVQYHHADEMRQVRRLMQPQPLVADAAGEAGVEPGMSEQAAAFAVLGADIESMGAAVARWWGMDEAVLHMIRRLPTSLPVRAADNDDEILRLVASAANEAVDTLALPGAQQAAAIERVAQRYARSLLVGLRDLQAALHASAENISAEAPTA